MTFSIITITFQAEAVLQCTLDSVLTQTYPHIEHLIVDGASKDGTLAIAKNYQQQSDAQHNGHTVIVQSEPDKGIYDAMNKGLAKATGDYVVFLNAGDWLPSSDTLEQVAEKAADRPAVLYGDTAIYDGEGHYLYPRRLRPPQNLSWRSFRHGMLVCHQAFYARLDIAKDIHYDIQYKYSGDVDWCIRVMKAAAQQKLPLHQVEAVIVNYTEEGATTQHHRESLRERYRVMCQHYGRITTLLMHLWFVVRSFIR